MREKQRRKDTWYVDEYQQDLVIHHRLKRIIADIQTKFQRVRIMELSRGICLDINGIFQSLVTDEAKYHEHLVHPAMLFHPKIRDMEILVIGVGPGAPLRELLKYEMRIRRITAIDIDREAIEAYREHLPMVHQGCYDSKKVEMVFQSAETFLSECTVSYDLIISDITDFSYFNLGEENKKEEEFYELIRKRLNRYGIFATHTTVFDEIYHDDHFSLHGLISGIFPRTFSYRTHIPSFTNVWGFIIASESPTFNPDSVSEIVLDQKIKKWEIKLNHLDGKILKSAFALPPVLRL